MNFVNQRASSINDDIEPFFFCLLPYLRGNSVGAENELGAAGHFSNGLDEMYSATGKIANDLLIMDNFMKHIQRGPMSFESSLYCRHGHFNAGTKSARLGKNNCFNCHIRLLIWRIQPRLSTDQLLSTLTNHIS